MILNNEGKEYYVSIGELSELTGIGVHTLRVWEKRYGIPKPIRLPSNHRRYPRLEVNRLQTITKVLDAGYKPGKVINRTIGRSDVVRESKLLDTDILINASEEIESILSNWLQATILYDENMLSKGLRQAWNECDPLKFITDFVAPFIKNVGIAWKSHELTTSQEHFASELLGNFLSEKWKKLNEKKENTNVVLANIPGEVHKLGLQMCAVITAFTNNGIIFLGGDNSCEDIAAGIESCQAKLLGISISSYIAEANSKEFLFKLRDRLGGSVFIAVGGTGAPDTIQGVTKFSEFSHYYKYLTEINK